MVDDEAALADVVASYLHREHFEVTVCHTGAEALAVARSPQVLKLGFAKAFFDRLKAAKAAKRSGD